MKVLPIHAVVGPVNGSSPGLITSGRIRKVAVEPAPWIGNWSGSAAETFGKEEKGGDEATLLKRGENCRSICLEQTPPWGKKNAGATANKLKDFKKGGGVGVGWRWE